MFYITWRDNDEHSIVTQKRDLPDDSLTAAQQYASELMEHIDAQAVLLVTNDERQWIAFNTVAQAPAHQVKAALVSLLQNPLYDVSEGHGFLAGYLGSADEYLAAKRP